MTATATAVAVATAAVAPVRCVGIDIAKQTVTVWVAGARQPLGTFANTPDGWLDLRQRLEAARAADGAAAARTQVVLEPTGGYEAGLARFALAQGWTVSLVQPLKVRHGADRQGRRSKTDRQDARLLADFGTANPLPPWQPLPEEVDVLDALVRRKADLEQLLQQERNRQQAAALRPGGPPAVAGSIGRIIAALEAELRQIDEAIAQHQQAHPVLQQQAQQLLTVPGIGKQMVLPVLTLLHRFQRLTGGDGDANQLVAYLGLDPRDHQRGTSVHRPARISRMGNRDLRRRLFMAALGGVRGHNALRGFYQRLVGRGKPKKLALVAAARKLLTWAWAVFRSGAAFAPDRALPRTAPLAAA